VIAAPFANLTPAANQAFERAGRAAASNAAQRITPEHLLLGVLDTPRTPVRALLAELGCDLAVLRESLGAAAKTTKNTAPGELDARARQVMSAAAREAQLLGHKRVDAVHLLLGILYESDTAAAQALTNAGVSLYELRQRIVQQPKRFRQRVPLPSLRGVVHVSPVFLVPLALMLLSGGALLAGVPERFAQPCTILFIVGGWIVSLCLHEFGHAVAAYLGGDDSVASAGYLTLNPLRYANPLLSIIMPLVFLFAGGLGLPGGAVYIRHDKLRGRAWDSFTSAAGPLATLLFGLLLTAPFYFDWMSWVTEANAAFWPALALLAFLQVSALMFNLLPIPPLDGFGIIAPLTLSWEARLRIRAIGAFATLALFMLLSRDNLLADVFWIAIWDTAAFVGLPTELVGYGWDQFFGS
jgi:Zn-dependent protease